MTPKEAAAALNGGDYRCEGSDDLFRAMKAAGLVAVFGASDDLIEFRGAIDDEADAWDGASVPVMKDGLPRSRCEEGGSCPYFQALVGKLRQIKALWDDGGFSWRYETIIPHEKFVINDDGEPYCEGIVFSLSDIPA